MKTTPLHTIHTDLKAKMAEFAGYDMPIQYEGVIAEHEWTRSSAGLFDVSHMGQVTLQGPGVVEFLEKLTPSSIAPMKEGRAKYTVLTNEDGGMVDDLIITRKGDQEFFLVINAGCKDKDIAWMNKHLPSDVTLTHHEDRALVALQGPKAEQIVRDVLEIDMAGTPYMAIKEHGPCFVSRLGYTGEDGFEISVPEGDAETLWNKLMAHDAVKSVGLAARDSLRLDMGYPLYGHDIDATTSPVEADIVWIMGRQDNKGFIGNERVLKELQDGPARIRVGIELTGKGVAREGAEIFSTEGQKIGVLTSGGFSPSLKKAIGQGYIDPLFKKDNTEVVVQVRGRDIAAKVTALPFVQARTKASVKKAA